MTQIKTPLAAAIAIFLPAFSAAAPTVDEPTKMSSCAMALPVEAANAPAPD